MNKKPRGSFKKPKVKTTILGNETDNADYGDIKVNGHTIELTTLVRQGLFADRKTPAEVMEWANSVDIYAVTAAAMMWNTLSNLYVMIPKDKLKDARS